MEKIEEAIKKFEESEDWYLYKDYEKREKSFKAGVQWGIKSKWISVDDRLPDENTSVLVCNANGTTYDEREADIAYLENGQFDGVWCGRELKVTHWMPLPDPFGENE